ncbi:MAG: phenylalanine--tRNA ligase subunit beta [Candidatus Nanoarchaeia archaeon]|nr:phenylalanine--tRNA ligase subunit beta [Candidatus Nanoarchaeia archaeon]
MTMIKVSKRELLKLIGKPLDDETLKDRISMIGTDLEYVQDDEVSVEIFPNRPDMLSCQGLARALSSFIGVKTGLKNYKIQKSNKQLLVDKSVKDIRPYTVCAIVKNLKLNDEKLKEIIDIQEKLHIGIGRNRKKVAIGIYPSEVISYPIRFEALAPEKIRFKPLESNIEMSAKDILEKHPKGKEYAHLLEGKEKYPIFIDSKNKILSMPPIINSNDTGKVTESTKEIFIECSGFSFESCKITLNILVTMFADIGGEIYSMDLIYPDKTYESPDLTPRKMKLDVSYINKLTGLELSEAEIRELLEKMGFGYENKKVLVPAYRSDILHQIDLAEEVAIAYGYENFIEEIPNVSTIGAEDPLEIFKKKIVYLLTGLDLIETNTYHLTNLNDHNEKMDNKTEVVEIQESKSSEYSVLRSWMIPSLLKVLSENRHNSYPQNIFEIGTTFKINKETETGVEESQRLAVLLSDAKTDFTHIKQILDAIFLNLDLEYSIEETEHNSFIPGRVGRISVKGKKIAYIGEIHPKVLVNFGLENPVAALEINITELSKLM